MTAEEELLLEQVTSAHRVRSVDGVIKSHPAWHDLDGPGRVAAFEATVKLRKLEQALDPAGMSTTVHAILSRLR